jgi:hypothetical protein
VCACGMQEVKKVVHYVGLTKKDLILALPSREKEAFWRALVVNCRMKFLKADESLALWKKLVDVSSDNFQVEWSDIMVSK